MKNQILSQIGDCCNSNCTCDPSRIPFIEVDERTAYIYDEDSDGKMLPCKLVQDNEYHQITVVNKTKKPFTFVKFDACIINDERRRCDALVYTDRQFYFVEIKDTTVKGRSQARRSAIKQLSSSIERFENVNFNDREQFAIIGFASPKSRIKSTNSDTQRAIFMEKYGIKLMEGHTISLE